MPKIAFSLIDIALVGTVVITMLALFVFVYIRENTIAKKLKSYERAIEQIYQLVNKKTDHQKESKEFKELADATNLLLDRFKTLTLENEEFKAAVIHKINDMETNTQFTPSISKISEHSANYETRILHLFDDGLEAHEIADQLRISIGEVELALNLNGVKR